MPNSSSCRLCSNGAMILALLTLGCTDDSSNPLGPGAPSLASGAVPPAHLVSVTVGGGSLTLWPYTGVDFSGVPQDPINLVFAGQADPRALRAALLALGGDRTAFGFPNVYPFNCVWSDAIGDLQTGYNGTAGWTGSAIQLACGDFGPVRFHVRLFDAGPVTLGNAHFEVLIPGTTEHQVLSWELAEQLATADLARTGLLGAAPGSTGLINDAPSFREIPAQIYNQLPPDLKQAAGGPTGSVSAPVPIHTDGRATVFQSSGTVAPTPGVSEQSFVIEWAQVIPRPFCVEGAAEFVLVEGPVSLRKTVELTSAGGLRSEFLASGQLSLTPVDPSTGSPLGPAYRASVEDYQVTGFEDAGGSIEGLVRQMELPQDVVGRGRKIVTLRVGADGATAFDQDIKCKRRG
ncbi:MAG TPA: hypothetical protein VFU40_04635 [Gemmatimonadales bacterium]|nr:hypothetical protein [Gemmatimonadales bacterium]